MSNYLIKYKLSKALNLAWKSVLEAINIYKILNFGNKKILKTAGIFKYI